MISNLFDIEIKGILGTRSSTRTGTTLVSRFVEFMGKKSLGERSPIEKPILDFNMVQHLKLLPISHDTKPHHRNFKHNPVKNFLLLYVFRLTFLF